MSRHRIDESPAEILSRVLALVVALVLTACSGGEPDEGAPSSPPAADLAIPAGAPKVIVLGDSISAGLHLLRPLEESFPARLQRRLVADDLPFHLVNAGVSGDTTAGGLTRLAWMLKQDPDVLVVELGANDGLRGVALESVESNLRGIVSGAKEAGVAVLLLGMRMPPNLGSDYADGFADIYPRVARELDVPLVDFFMRGVAGEPDLNHPDGIHPNDEGHAILADNVEPALRDLLEALESDR